jgi:hypothetical protein
VTAGLLQELLLAMRLQALERAGHPIGGWPPYSQLFWNARRVEWLAQNAIGHDMLPRFTHLQSLTLHGVHVQSGILGEVRTLRRVSFVYVLPDDLLDSLRLITCPPAHVDTLCLECTGSSTHSTTLYATDFIEYVNGVQERSILGLWTGVTHLSVRAPYVEGLPFLVLGCPQVRCLKVVETGRMYKFVCLRERATKPCEFTCPQIEEFSYTVCNARTVGGVVRPLLLDLRDAFPMIRRLFVECKRDLVVEWSGYLPVDAPPSLEAYEVRAILPCDRWARGRRTSDGWLTAVGGSNK